MISVELAKKLAKYLPWEPKVGDLTIIIDETGAEEIIQPIIPSHKRDRKLVLSLREVGDLVWLPHLTRLLYEIKIRTASDFSLIYHKQKDQWCFAGENIEFWEETPENAAARALLEVFADNDGLSAERTAGC
ncbi:MAG: Uncharacterized protein XD97_0444 [Pelotomaculum thermopropionicum]|uniref:Phage ABA sandwich domain-containing protein n=1 Tax=Pelotomaculum thermopropionicum TaxID=110500 RepID=A0A117M3J4_9FIRM|nr:MAG: Uncharacterized protein XD97_0444 [Pelotomaculum thermopropionicum]